ncbi:hypothetical protein O7A70_23715 [Mesorhizobium sp. Cs1299R1N1]|uniref:hypothetical protein n=1 Tax=Mesorhizobium sp. Cs1299R1N1 TaxID=3015172 RepID=UPI00301D08D0
MRSVGKDCSGMVALHSLSDGRAEGDRQAPEINAIIETMMEARRFIIERIKVLAARVLAAAKQNAMARLFRTALGVVTVLLRRLPRPVTMLPASVDPPAPAHISGLAPRRYESSEVSRNGRVSKRGGSARPRDHLEPARTRGCNILSTAQSEDRTVNGLLCVPVDCSRCSNAN